MPLTTPAPFSRSRFMVPCLGVCALLSLAACGGKGGSSTKPVVTPGSTAIPVGSWSGMAKKAGVADHAVNALVLGDGTYTIFDDKHLGIAKGTWAQGVSQASALAVDSAGEVKASSENLMVKTYQPQDGLVISDDQGTTFTFDTYYSGYDAPLDTAALQAAAGLSSSAQANNLKLDLKISFKADMTFTGSYNGGSLSGTYTIPDPTKSAIKLSATVVSPDGKTSEVMSGNATFLTLGGDATKTLDIAVSGSTDFFSGSFK